MKTAIRIILSLFVFVASYLFCTLAISSLLPQIRENRLLAISIPLFIAIAISVLAWKKMSINAARLEIYMLVWGIIIGSIGLIVGFLGPILFHWGGNQGPLLGILYTGPLGFTIGMISGAICWKLYRTRKLINS
jgi:hypothetical protein